jgi:hypothetical protein
MNYPKRVILRFDKYHENRISSKFYNNNALSIDDLFYDDKFLIKAFTEEYIKEPKYKDLNITDVTLKAGDNVYFVPGVSVPRYKFKDKGDEVGFKTKRSADAANIVVIDEKTFEKNTKTQSWSASFRCLDYSNLETIFSTLNLNIEDIISEEQKELIESTNASVLVETFVNTVLTRGMGNIFDNNENYREAVNSYHYEYVNFKANYPEIDNFLCFLEHVETSGKTLTSATCILKQVAAKTDLTESMYKRLDQMLKSDHASQELAMETITNLNVESNFFLLLKLINDNRGIRWHKAFNHVNFKAFRNILDEKVRPVRNSKDYLFINSLYYNDVIDILGSLKILKQEHIEYFLKDIKKDMSYSVASRYFKIERITATDQLKKYLEESKENLESKKVEDELV